MEKVSEEESWNKKRIFVTAITLILLVGTIYFFKDFILNKGKALFFKSPSDIKRNVEGINVVENSSSLSPTSSPQPLAGIQKVVQEKLNTIKQEITTLKVQDVASSSPQLQKIINDLQSLQQYPRNELKDVCQKLCGGL